MKRKNINKKMLVGVEKVEQSLQFLLFGKKVDGESIRDCNPLKVELYEKMLIIAKKPINYLMYNTQLTKQMLEHIHDMYGVESVELSKTYSENVYLQILCYGYIISYTFNIKTSRWYENAYQELARVDIRANQK